MVDYQKFRPAVRIVMKSGNDHAFFFDTMEEAKAVWKRVSSAVMNADRAGEGFMWVEETSDAGGILLPLDDIGCIKYENLSVFSYMK